MTTWPASLPQYLDQQGYGESPPNLMIRSQVDVGPAKSRKRFTSAIRPIQGGMVVTAAQLEIFDEFYNDDLAGGALSFDWVHPRTQAACSMRFTKPPQYSAVGAVYQLTMELEILP